MEISEIAVLKKLALLFAATALMVTAGQLAVKKRLGFASSVFLIPVLAAAAIGGYAYLIEPNWIQVTKVKIHDPALAEVLGNTRIVQITDIHLTQGLGFREKSMIQKINALKPDIVFFTGDLFDHTSQIEPALKIFRSIEANLGIFGIPGDTDLIVVDSPAFERTMSPVMEVLRNRAGHLTLPNGKRAWIVGVDHHSRINLNRALGGIPSGEPVLVLSPSPDIFHDAAEQGVNLVLTGDTHGGQVGIDFLIRMSDYANRTPYMRGLFKKDRTQMYVNRGIGVKTRPIRFLCRPEIALIQVVP
jgi:predicted MPP superfamily phosphohydrolase